MSDAKNYAVRVGEKIAEIETLFREVERARQGLLAQRADTQILPAPRPPTT